ncbi:hypothetical protein KFK09_017485 [Dendrobium nobile]|uniref:RNase H type-1 domain-containing protein n=1 Tax=Dendrobium nobile TaxID=94219 RepID=A0A8T3B3K2_DENNO|nr:hypothetical protein KFK09_017485 [Dendrobium nobile]
MGRTALQINSIIHLELNSNSFISFLWDPWLHGKSIMAEFANHNLENIIPYHASVSDFLREDGWLLPTAIPDSIANSLQQFGFNQGFKDTLLWHGSDKVCFSSFINYYHREEAKIDWFNLVWHKHYALRVFCRWMSGYGENVFTYLLNVITVLRLKILNMFFFLVSVLSVLTDWMSNVRGNVLNILHICILWFLWKARNEAKHDGIKMKDTVIISNINHRLLQFFNAKLISSYNMSKCQDLCVKLGMSIHLEDAIRRERIVRWLKPKAPAIKLNSDGSVDNYSAGFGGIIRDSFGKVIVAFAGPLPPCMVIYAELMGLLKGLNICIKRGFIYVEIEVDALNVIQIINSTHISYPQFFYLIREIKSALSNLNFTLAHLLREGNACADALAKLGSTLEEEREFDMENLPRLVKANACADWLANYGCQMDTYQELNITSLHPALKGHQGLKGLLILVYCYQSCSLSYSGKFELNEIN